MSDYRATPEIWSYIESFAGDPRDIANAILELRARVEALEANTKQWRTDHLRLANTCASMAPDRLQFFSDLLPEEANAKPTPKDRQIRSSLVERVATVIANPYCPADFWHDSARAAIREVAAWLRDQSPVMHRSGPHWAEVLEQEAE